MSEVFLKIVNMSISASWLVLAVLFLRLVIKKAPKWVSVLLWGLVAIRLICPVSIESALSLVPSTGTIPVQMIADLTVDTQGDLPQSNGPAQEEPEPGIHGNVGVQAAPGVAMPEKQPIQVVTVLTGLWLAGVGTMVLYTAGSYSLLRRRVATAVRLRDNIYRSEYVDSPFVLGFLAPKIYLPFRMDGQSEAHVIAHEEAHIRRKDHWWKPVGFVLLAVHWFNPLMWVGYVLLCRDIELACDEKVIKEMSSETKADYTAALVSCSVNRRRIAACPLAFGEVGVKERVKTVMNYKKPAFWIVIAAVALCIVVAVSFLTDPVKQINQIADVSLLEFPGVKWGVSPEEVIASLGLTEEQIQSKTYRDEGYATDSCYLVATNVPFFDEVASSASFEFRNTNGKGYRLFSIKLFLDENADMERVNATLAKVYGKGTGKYYLNYTIDHTGALKEFKSGGDANLNFFANNLPDSYSGQAIRDAVLSIVNDPEYAVENWVSSVKGTDFLTADEQELIIQYYEENKITDKETLMQWLEKMPLVAISTLNRSFSVALAEAENRSTTATNNQIIYNAGTLLSYVERNELLRGDITPEEPKEATSPAKSPDLPWLFFPKVSWGMEPYQIKEIHGLTEEQVLTEGPDGDRYILHVKDVSFFGSEVASAQFIFLTTEVGQHLLSDVMLYYPEGTDMEAIKNNLTAFYTEPTEGNGFTRYRISETGIVESYIDYGVADPDSVGAGSVTAWWESETKLDSVLGSDIQEMMKKRAVLLHGNDESWADAVWEYLGKEPSAFICCTDSGKTEGLDPAYCTKNIVSFSAYTYTSTIISYL